MKNPLSLYVHWPYCLVKCPYCDFFSITSKPRTQEFFQAYTHDLKFFHKKIGKKRLKSIFFGGGTPSLMDHELVSYVIGQAKEFFDFEENIEITLEANPTSLETKKIEDFLSAGINRLSIGIQALDQKYLTFLGRNHTADEALLMLDRAKTFMDNVSCDLIYALPEQTLFEWKKDLEKILSFHTKHLSLYQLVIEPGTRFERDFKESKFTMLDSDTCANFYETTQEMLKENGFEAYEVSNYAKKGYESIHNLTYWNYEDYMGIGPGAHSRITLNAKKHSISFQKNIESWLSHTLPEWSPLTKQEEISEKIMMGLRLKSGIKMDSDFEPLMDKVHVLIENDLISIKDGYISLKDLKLHQGVLRFLLP